MKRKCVCFPFTEHHVPEKEASSETRRKRQCQQSRLFYGQVHLESKKNELKNAKILATFLFPLTRREQLRRKKKHQYEKKRICYAFCRTHYGQQ